MVMAISSRFGDEPIDAAHYAVSLHTPCEVCLFLCGGLSPRLRSIACEANASALADVQIEEKE
jgi:hypothetical protein